MLTTGRRMLVIGAVLVACVSVFHIACAIVGPAAYRNLGAGEGMVSAAASGAWWPAILTVGLAAVFAIFSLYALSAAGYVRPLPLTRVAIIVGGVVFVLRGISLGPQLVGFVRSHDLIAGRNLFYSVVAMLIGLFYLFGLAFGRGRRFREGGQR